MSKQAILKAEFDKRSGSLGKVLASLKDGAKADYDKRCADYEAVYDSEMQALREEFGFFGDVGESVQAKPPGSGE